MIVTQLAEFLNNTMIPQYLGKEAIKVEDLSPIVSVGAYTKVDAPPVEPTKIASMKTTDYTAGTATIVNTENANKPFACSSKNTSEKTLSQCITQATGGIQNTYFGQIKTADDILDDDFIISLKFKFVASYEYEYDMDLMSSSAICGFINSSSNVAGSFSYDSGNEPTSLTFSVSYTDTAVKTDVEIVDDDWTSSVMNVNNTHTVFVSKEATLSANSEHTLLITKVDNKIVYSLDDTVVFIETVKTTTVDKDNFIIGSRASTILGQTIIVEELDIFKINEE